tara:strand:- start:154 stop:474 length:321 start_codon:yes stop_codon:yes gene_type:complete
MTQAYSDPSRETDQHALSDIEVFHASPSEFTCAQPGTWQAAIMESFGAEAGNDNISAREHFSRSANAASGYYWWSCFPGCLPDSDPIGPFETLADAIADAQGGADS